MENMTIQLGFEICEEQQERLYDFLCDELSHSEFLVLNEDTQEEYLLETQEEMLWTFNPTFIMNHLKDVIYNEFNSDYDRNDFRKWLEKIQGDLCESGNVFIKAVTDWKEMLLEGARIDGYGHFLSQYDHEEYEIEFEGLNILVYKQ